MTESPVRILIADDHPLFREGLRLLLTAEPGFQVIESAGDGEQAVEMCRRLAPDVLLLDVSMPNLSGIEALARISAECPGVRTVVLTANIERRQVIQALTGGARAVVMKETASTTLFECIRDVMMGGYWMGGTAAGEIVTALREMQPRPEPDGSPLSLLTVRERQIVAAVAQGATNDDIGRQFGLCRQTVKNHLTGIFDKLGVSNRLELALFAVSHHLADGLVPVSR